MLVSITIISRPNDDQWNDRPIHKLTFKLRGKVVSVIMISHNVAWYLVGDGFDSLLGQVLFKARADIVFGFAQGSIEGYEWICEEIR